MGAPREIKQEIIAEAFDLGFVLCGFSAAQTPLHYEYYLRWLEAGCQAKMAYMARPNAVSVREHPEALLPGCQTVISLAMAYAPVAKGSHERLGVPLGRIAAYATYADYHEVMTSALNSLIDRLEILSNAGSYIAVDTAPILEKEFAASAGLGMIGRNSLLTNPVYGSWLLLGEILTTLNIEPDHQTPTIDCQDCQRCVMACPTKATRPDRSIDARRCLSYLTIEHRGEIPEIFREAMGNRIFGCDACQAACPHNRDLPGQPSAFFTHPVLESNQDLIDALRWSEVEFKEKFANTPVLRCRYSGWRRNVAIALGNSNHAGALPALWEALTNEADLVVREAIEWALARLESIP
jgi:epoxyqueuosine reductase